MQNWKRLTLAGNRAMETAQRDRAQAAHRQALTEAERLLDDWPDANEAIAAYIATRHSLADCYLQDGEPELAFLELQAAYGRVLSLLRHGRVPPAARLDALRQRHGALRALLRFARAWGLDDRLGPAGEPRFAPVVLEGFG